MASIYEVVATSRLFGSLPDDAIARLCAWMRLRGVDAGEPVVSEGEPAGALVLVAEGTLLVSKALERRSEALVTRLGPGDHAGELDLIDARRASASVVAETDATLVVLEQRRLRQMLVTDRTLFGHVSRALFVDLSQKVRQTNDRVRDAIAWGLDATGQAES